MRRASVFVTDRPLRYHTEEILLADGTSKTIDVPQEKGIDLRLGLDVVRMARGGQLDVAIIFSQDQDLAEVVQEVREISRSSNRWIKVVSAFPTGPAATVKRGINGAEWFVMDQAFYDQCLDHHDYRPKKAP